MFSLPPVPCEALREAGFDLDATMAGAAKVSPLLTVLPMGWTWSLFFCQALVVAQVLAAGVSEDRFFEDRKAAPKIDETPGAAVCVDGVAALGCDPSAVDETIHRVHDQLEASNLRCKGVSDASQRQKFTGLDFDAETGRIMVSGQRVWKLRRALLAVAERGWCSGAEMLSLLGHFTWAAILRRCLLSIFHSAYRFTLEAGPRRWRL